MDYFRSAWMQSLWFDYGSGRIDAAKLWIYTSAYPSTSEVRAVASSVRCIQE